MAVIPVSKIRCYVPRQQAADLTAFLQQRGIAELSHETTLTPGIVTDFGTTTTHAQVEAARAFLSSYHAVDFLRAAFEGGRAHTTTQELAALAESSDVDSILSAVTAFQSRLAELERSIRAHELTLRSLHTFERLDIPLNQVGQTATTTTFAVRGPARLLTSLRQDLTVFETSIAITTLSSSAALIMCLQSTSEAIEAMIIAHGLEIVTLPASHQTGAALYAEITTELAAAESAKASLTTEISSYASSHLPTLQKLTDITNWQRQVDTTAQALPTTKRTAIVVAWVPTSAITPLEADLKATIPASALEVIDHGDEVPPTELQNDGLVTPFESVTRLYGVPDYKDLDPTPLLAVFFFVFFGLCLSDVGYGLILMTLTGLILWRYHLAPGTKQLLTLLFFGGVGTVCAGILFGGYLGIPPGDIHPALVSLQKFDPIANPLPVFYLSLVLGFVQVCFGIFLNLVRQMKLGATKDALLDNGPWLIFFVLIAVAILNLTGYLPETVQAVVATHQTTAFVSALVLLVITQGRTQKNPIMKLLFGLLGLYGAVGYFADVLSYSRLMALGLATGALAFSINSIAAFVGGESLGIGTVFMVLVLILGHTLNLAISILGTFINSARLQFVEFFSKFSTGTGRAFTPFTKTPQHIIVLPDPPHPSP